MANTIYKVQVTNNINDEHKKNLGAAETSFKERYSNHMWDFKHKNIWSVPNFQSIFGGC